GCCGIPVQRGSTPRWYMNFGRRPIHMMYVTSCGSAGSSVQLLESPTGEALPGPTVGIYCLTSINGDRSGWMNTTQQLGQQKPAGDPGGQALSTPEHIALVEKRSAHNYSPLPVVIAEGRGAWVADVEGTKYLDCLAGYSAMNFGHHNPELLAAAHRQLDRVTLTSQIGRAHV